MLKQCKTNREKEIIAYRHYCGYKDPNAGNRFKKIKAWFWLQVHKYYDNKAFNDFMNS